MSKLEGLKNNKGGWNNGLPCRIFRPKPNTVTMVPASTPQDNESDRTMQESGYKYQAMTSMANMELYDTIGHNPMPASQLGFRLNEADLDKALSVGTVRPMGVSSAPINKMIKINLIKGK